MACRGDAEPGGDDDSQDDEHQGSGKEEQLQIAEHSGALDFIGDEPDALEDDADQGHGDETLDELAGEGHGTGIESRTLSPGNELIHIDYGGQDGPGNENRRTGSRADESASESQEQQGRGRGQ